MKCPKCAICGECMHCSVHTVGPFAGGHEFKPLREAQLEGVQLDMINPERAKKVYFKE